MAESGYKVRAIGAPFEIKYSSCSNLKPNTFNWTTENSEWDVYIDRGMMQQPDFSTPKEKRYGWVCESRFIIPDVYNFLIHNHKVLFKNYYNKIFTCDQSLLDLDANFVYCPVGSNYPWISKEQWKIYNKTKLCSMFCSPKLRTEGHAYRHQIARLALDTGIDVFGGAHGTPRTVVDPTNPWSTKIDGVKDYMFSIVIENGIYDSYWTEKITDCFATGTVPVYFGTKKITEVFDSDGIIFLESNKEQQILETLSESVYNSKLNSIQKNLQTVKLLELADDFLFKLIKN